MADADVIVHLAAKVGGVDYLRRNGVSAYYDNVTMGMNVVQASLTGSAQPAGAYRHAVQLSGRRTAAAVRGRYLLGAGQWRRAGPYGLAKATISHVANPLLAAAGKDVVTLIPGNLYGPGDNFELR